MTTRRFVIVLQMSSGVEWTEVYDDLQSDINNVTWPTLESTSTCVQAARSPLAGEVYNYNTAETNLVGTLLRSAIGNNLSTYLSEKIWKPFGMEHDAYWVLSEEGGGEFGGSSLNATLARLCPHRPLFAMQNGRLRNGESVLPDGWMEESTTPSAGLKNTGIYGGSTAMVPMQPPGYSGREFTSTQKKSWLSPFKVLAKTRVVHKTGFCRMRFMQHFAVRCRTREKIHEVLVSHCYHFAPPRWLY